jgi:hypothetical protein
MEVDPSVGIVKKYSVAAKVMPKEEDASTKESAPDAVAPLAQGCDATHGVTNIVAASKQPSRAMPTSATMVTTAQSHTASAMQVQ